MQKYFTKKDVLLIILGIFIVVAIVIATAYISQLAKRKNTLNPASYTTQTVSFPVSSPQTQETTADYSVKLSGPYPYDSIDVFYTLIYAKNGVEKEIYRWRTYDQFGIGGGANCRKILYSPSKNHFMICNNSAVGLSHWGIPLLFNKNGEKVVDFANIKNFSVKTEKANNGDTILWANKLQKIEWIDDNTISLLMLKDELAFETETWTYKIGDDEITR